MDLLACKKNGPRGTKIWRRLGCVKTEFQARTGGADPSLEVQGPLNLQGTYWLCWPRWAYEVDLAEEAA